MVEVTSIAEVVLQLDQISRHNEALAAENAELHTRIVEFIGKRDPGYRSLVAHISALTDDLSAEVERLRSENAALRAAIAAIQNLHQIGTYYSDIPLSRRSPFTGCVQCEQAWPCPTITTIGDLP